MADAARASDSSAATTAANSTAASAPAACVDGDDDAADAGFNEFSQAIMETLKAHFPKLTSQQRSSLAARAWQQGYNLGTKQQAVAFCTEAIESAAAAAVQAAQAEAAVGVKLQVGGGSGNTPQSQCFHLLPYRRLLCARVRGHGVRT